MAIDSNTARKNALQQKANEFRIQGTPAALERATDIEGMLLDILKAENELKVRVMEGELEISVKLTEAELKANEPLETPETVVPD